ncbi:MAG: capsule assembly Wzi family protein [Bacteroidota bacterium]|nr:capsule assembly Wzi family protein [Bacteroidota bacterium]
MKKIILLLMFLSFASAFAQVVYEPLYKDIYVYLGRMSQKGIIELNDQIKPLSKKYIAEKLLEISSKENQLNGLEKQELEFYKKDYYDELSFLSPQDTSATGTNLLGKDPSGRSRLFSYKDKLFKVNLSPILGYEKGSIGSKSYSHQWSGLYFYGYLTDKIGFSFDYRDNSEKGENIDRTKAFTPTTGAIVAYGSKNEIQYSEVRTTLATDWSWGSAMIGKDFLEWGYGESGKLVLSEKAPSFPFLRLDINPVSWLKFNYIHAWLNSDVVDSTEMYRSYRLNHKFDRTVFRQKFLASHSLIFTPYSGLNISLGESVIYSDKLELSYLMPLMFFRLADHYLSRGNNNAGSNSQFFLGISSRDHLKNTHLYGTLYIDEISIEDLFDHSKQRNQLGFTLGGSVTDLPVDNLSFTVEYTKTYPFIYRHYIPTQTYTNSGYQLGHWIGDNADMIYGSLNYRFIRGLQATLWGEHIRRGEYDLSEGVELQYGPVQPPFLFGLRRNYTNAGIEIKYELTHELFARARFNHNDSSIEQNSNGSFVDKKSNEFYLALYYGL